METEATYEMTVDLNVLNHLGISLYSNTPAVLAEAVANAWDADAETVEVEISDDYATIKISDDGHGMSRADINAKFLTVGYQRREQGGSVTQKHRRAVMGRKGIGKLSLRGHDLRPVENVKDSRLLSTCVDALGSPEQSRLDRIVGADRSPCGGCGAL